MLSYQTIRSSLDAQPLFEAKTWQLSPEAWPLTAAQVKTLEEIGTACLEFHQALETLYFRSATGKNLLRNKPLQAPWVAEYLDRGKPRELIEHSRDAANRGRFPTVLRPDLLLTEDGFTMTELDSVPGGIGLTAFLNRLYGAEKAGLAGASILGANDAMIRGFYESLSGLLPGAGNPVIALLVSEEAATYKPEMEWLAQQLQLLGKRVFCLRTDQIFPLEDSLFFDLDGAPEKIDILYRFFELFDLSNIRTAPYIFEAWKAGTVLVAPPMRHFQEEKLSLALFQHHRLQDFWGEQLGKRSLALLRQLIPPSWVLDPAPLPPGAVLEGPKIGGRPLNDWNELAGASQKERDLIVKISGYHETAWGARSVLLGSDCSREEWQTGLSGALKLAPTHLHLLQSYRKPKRAQHPLYPTPEPNAEAPQEAQPRDGRLRLCPYYFVINNQARLGGALATFCPPDKKIIHGMQDAALIPCRIVEAVNNP